MCDTLGFPQLFLTFTQSFFYPLALGNVPTHTSAANSLTSTIFFWGEYGMDMQFTSTFGVYTVLDFHCITGIG